MLTTGEVIYFKSSRFRSFSNLGHGVDSDDKLGATQFGIPVGNGSSGLRESVNQPDAVPTGSRLINKQVLR